MNRTAFAVTILLGLSAVAAHSQVSFQVNRVVQVAATGTPEENCQGLFGALASITDNSGSNPYLVRLEPGHYDCGGSIVFVFEGITLEGAGRNNTFIKGELDSGSFGVVHLQDSFTGLRSLNVSNTQDSPSHGAIAISIFQFSLAPGGGGPISEIELREVETSAYIYNIYSLDARFSAWKSVFPLRDIFLNGSGSPVLRYSRVRGVFGTASFRCLFCSDDFSQPLNSSCQLPPP